MSKPTTGGEKEGLLPRQATTDDVEAAAAVESEHDKCARRWSVKAAVAAGLAVLVLVYKHPPPWSIFNLLITLPEIGRATCRARV